MTIYSRLCSARVLSMTPNGYPLIYGRSLGATTPSTYESTSIAPSGGTEKNPKSQLLEFFQKKQGTPRFTTSQLTKPPANPSFKCVLVCPAVSNPYGPERSIPETAFEGSARSKKLAEQAACIQALELYRSKRLLGNLKTVQNMSPAPSPIPETSQVFTVAPTSLQQTGSVNDVFVQPNIMPGSVAMQPSIMQGGVAMQPVMLNNGLTVQPTTGMVQQQPAFAINPGNPPELQYSGPMTSDSDNPGHGNFPDSEGEEEEENEYSLDNSDCQRRRADILSSTNLHEVQQLAIAALDEILLLREELFETQMSIKDRRRGAKKIYRLAKELASL